MPLDPRATYIMVAREPLDMAVSLYHQGDNIDRARMRELTGQPEPARLRPGSSEQPASLPGATWHLADAWA
jgi:aryl sulfotransferase